MPRLRITLLLGVAVLPLLVATACGSKSTSTTAGATATTQPAAGGDFAAYRQCLSDHGASVPDRSQGGGNGGPPGTDLGGTGGSGGRGGFGGPNSTDPTMQAAQDACKDLRPSGGGPGNGQGAGGQALAAYRSCLQDHGVTVPTSPDATDGTTPGRRAGPTGGLDQSDPTVAAAMTACQALLPARPGDGGGDPAPSTTTTTPGAA